MRINRFKIIESYTPERRRIDKERGIIYDVLIVGQRSRNKRKYSDKVLDRDAWRYEGKSVYINHELVKLPDGSYKPARRGVDEEGGVIRNVSRRDGGLRGDIHYRMNTHAGKIVLECCERFPDKHGLSHVATVDGRRDKSTGEVDILAIVEVHSVDIVNNPSTTNTIYEEIISVDDALLQLHTAIENDTKTDKASIATELNKLAKSLGHVEVVAEEAEADKRFKALEERLDKIMAAMDKRPVKTLPAIKSAGRAVVSEEINETKTDKKVPTKKKDILNAWGAE